MKRRIYTLSTLRRLEVLKVVKLKVSSPEMINMERFEPLVAKDMQAHQCFDTVKPRGYLGMFPVF
jgi:hypothetical protein